MSPSSKRMAGPYAWLPALIGFVALAGLVIGYAGLANLKDRLVAGAGRTLALTASESIAKLDLVLAEHVRRLRFFSRDPALALDDELTVTARLRAFAGTHREFRWVGVTDLTGRVMAASDPARIGSAVTPSAWVQIARDVGLDVRPVPSSTTDRIATPLLAFTVPLMDAAGTVRGTLVAHTTLAHVKRLFDRSTQNLHRKWDGAVGVHWHLVSPNGDLIAGTRRGAALGKLALPSAFASAGARPGYLEERDPIRNAPMLTGYARMHGRRFAGAPRWALLVHADKHDLVRPIVGTITLLGTLWALVTAPLLLLTIWATARLRHEWSESRDESRRALAARREADASEARMRAILDHAAEGIITVDDEGRIESFNAAAVRMFGVAQDTVRGMSIARLVPSGAVGRHDRTRGRHDRMRGRTDHAVARHDRTVARWLTRAVARANGRTIEILARRSDGSDFPLDLALSQVTTGDRRVFIGIVRDLTEKKRAESERGILASIIEHTDDLVGMSSLDGRVLFINPAGRRLVGLDPAASLAELRLDDFVHPADRATFDNVAIPAVLRTGRWEGELRGRHFVTDEPIVAAVNLFLVHRPETGRTTGFAAVCRDLREHKRIEADTQRARDLTLAKEIAESASLAKSQFLANMSHEIRTPLNGVVGMTALLLDTKLNDEQREYAESLRTCSVSLLAVIDDVLDFSKMEAGKLDLEVIDFDLRRTIEEIVELFAERAHRKGIELTALIDPATPSALRGDPNRLRQMLTNLLGNALKFTERGEVVVRARTVGDGPTHARIELAVTDSGIGIAPEQQAMIFESFAQSDVSTARLYGGSGLGLAIVKRLAELMNGQIVVDSEAGVGSTFTLVLRFPKQGKTADVRVPSVLTGRRVLVVDDNPTVRAVLRAYLRALGVRCTSSEDGANALALVRAAAARRRPYDAVLLDWEMPILDGVEVARAIKREPTIGKVPVVLLTALGQRSAARRAARGGGITAYLSKPVRTDRLEACLLDMLAPTRVAADGPSPTIESRRVSRGARILVAEDDATSQQVIRRLLEKRGHRVDAVGDGRSAVEACLGREYDLVLMDCRLPELDGFAATLEIRRREPAERRTPIVALTATISPERRQRCIDVGMGDYLGKPIHTEALDAVLASWLSPDRPRSMGPFAEPPVLDADGLLDRVDGDVAFVRELLAGLRQDGPRWIAELRAAIARADHGKTEEIAHAVRGATSNLGGARAAATAARLEAAAHDGTVGDGARHATDLARELDHLLAALDALGDQRAAAR